MVTKNTTGGGGSPPPSNVPVPDPTILTTQALQREIAASRELIEIKVEAARHALEVRITGIDKAIGLMDTRADLLINKSLHEVKQLQSLHETKFSAIQVQFEERDKRTEQLTLADKTAIAAALQAQKEAVNAQNFANATAAVKSELAFTKQIEQLQSIVNTITKSIDDKISDLKSRLDLDMGTRKGTSDTSSVIMGVAAIFISFATLFFLVYSRTNTTTTYPQAVTRP